MIFFPHSTTVTRIQQYVPRLTQIIMYCSDYFQATKKIKSYVRTEHVIKLILNATQKEKMHICVYNYKHHCMGFFRVVISLGRTQLSTWAYALLPKLCFSKKLLSIILIQTCCSQCSARICTDRASNQLAILQIELDLIVPCWLTLHLTIILIHRRMQNNVLAN